MAKYHISPDGFARPCHAGKGENARGCKYGYSDAEHYESLSEAKIGAEKKMDKENGGSFGLKKKKEPVNVDYGSLPVSNKLDLINNKDYQAMDVLVSDEDWQVRTEVAVHGTNEHRDKLVNDYDSWVRLRVAEFGSNAHRDVLVMDNNWLVRTEVAAYGSDAHRDKLINDPNYLVRAAVARFGSSKHRDKLVWDEDSNVRIEVANHGSVEQLVFLINDENEQVREQAKNRFDSLS